MNQIIAQAGPGGIAQVVNLIFVIGIISLPVIILIYFVKSDRKKTEMLKSISEDLNEIKDRLKSE